MSGAQFTQHIRLEVCDVPSRSGIFNQGAISLFHFIPVNLLHFGVVKKVAVPSPCIHKDLLPLFSYYMLHYQAIGGNGILYTLARGGLNNSILSPCRNQNGFSI